jgi:hypothetical protein
MSSLVNTLPRWYWTVLALMNSRAPISGLVRPSPANRAICSSWGVSCGPLAMAVRLRALTPGGRKLAPGPLGEPAHPHGVEHVARDAQWCPGFNAAALAAQPFPVEQMGTGQVGAHAGPAQPLDRLAVQTLGIRCRAEQRARTGLDANAQSVPLALVVSISRTRASRGGIRRTATRAGFDELGRGELGHIAEAGLLGATSCNGHGICVAAEAIAEQRVGPLDHGEPGAFAPGNCGLGCCFDQSS